MPSNVRNFFWLNFLSLVMGIASATLTESKVNQMAASAGHGPGFVIFIRVIVMVILLFLLWLIAFKRQNWARWLWLAMFILGGPAYIATFKSIFGLSLAGAISLTQLGLQFVALYFIFTGNAKPWFRKPAEAEGA